MIGLRFESRTRTTIMNDRIESIFVVRYLLSWFTVLYNYDAVRWAGVGHNRSYAGDARKPR